MPADSGEAGVGANIGTGLRGCRALPLIAEKCAPFQSLPAYPGRVAGVGLAIIAYPRRTAPMPQFNDTELTAAVIRSFEETPEPRVKFLMEELVKSLHDFVRKTDLSFDEWGYAIDFLTRVGQKCSSTRQEFILRARGLDAGRCGESSPARRRDRDHRARPVLCRRTQADAAWRRYLRQSDRRNDVCAEPRHRPEGQTACGRAGRRLARRQ